MAKMNYPKWGYYCDLFGVTPRNRVMEEFLTVTGMDFPTSAIANATELNRASVYNEVKALLKEGYIIPSRVVSGAQFYKLNKNKREAKLLMKVMALLLDDIVEEHSEKNPQKKQVAIASKTKKRN